MAIYKLGEIFSITNGSTPNTNNINFWNPDINWYTPIDLKNNTHTIRKISKNFRKKLLPKETIMISSRAPIGYVGITQDQSWHSQGIKGFINDEKKVLNKYFFYWTLINIGKFINISSGTTFNEISSKNIKTIKGNFPSLKIQKQIIDIIEPYEKLFLSYSKCVRIDNISNTKKDIKNLIDIIEPIEKLELTIKKLSKVIGFITKNTFITFSEKNDYNFQKGLLPIKNKVGITPFLNVSAANNKINRYVINEPNIKIGDVTISLDGNTGLVNNSLEGFNGYLFKVTSKKWKNYQIYYSLKNKINQKIIKLNETGTTIKHSSKSKKAIFHLEFLEDFLLKEMFNLEISIFKIVTKLKKVKKLLINLLIN